MTTAPHDHTAPPPAVPVTPVDPAQQTPAPSATAPTARPAQLGRVVGSGITLMIVATIANKGISLVAQWILGRELSPDEFAIYAYATAIAGFTMICRDAGTRELLVQRGHKEYEDLAGPVFWLSFWYNVAVAIVMAAIAWPVAHYLKQPTLKPMLWVMAAALPLATLGSILHSTMRVQLQFRHYAANAIFGSIARQGSSMALALRGLGAMSLSWPVLIGGIVESIGALILTRDPLWKRKAEPRRWPEIMRHCKWLMFASIANFAVDWGPFLFLGALTAHAQTTGRGLTDAESGYFFFAFMTTAQVGVLLSHNFSIVVTPVLARLSEDRERLASGVLRTLRTLMLAACFGSLGLAAVIKPLERLLWNGKWADAVPAVVILGVFFPWRITYGICTSLLQGQGRFRLYALLTVIQGAGLTIFTVVGALVEPTATSMAIWAGVWLFVSIAGLTVWVFQTIGISWKGVLASTLPAWAIALAAAAAGYVTGDPDHYTSMSGPQWARDLLAFTVGGATCALSGGILCRILLRSHLEEMLAVAPARLRPLAAKFLLLPLPD